MTLYEAIKKAWFEAGDAWDRPPHLQTKADLGRELDNQLADLIKEPIQMWQDGLMSASELVDKVYIAAGTEVE